MNPLNKQIRTFIYNTLLDYLESEFTWRNLQNLIHIQFGVKPNLTDLKSTVKSLQIEGFAIIYLPSRILPTKDTKLIAKRVKNLEELKAQINLELIQLHNVELKVEAA